MPIPPARSSRAHVVWMALATLLCLPAPGAAATDFHARVSAEVAKRRAAILEELTEFLAMPNVSRHRDEMRRNADHLLGLLERRGMSARILMAGGAPYLFARLPAAGTPTATVLIYCHFDGQPVDRARWTVTAPFEPLLVGELDDPDARLYARSASDDKSPIIALLAALDILQDLGLPPTVELKLILDPEEEISSPNLPEILARHHDLLAADLMIFADGPVHQSGRSTVVFGIRGIVTATLTMYGADRPLHSGHYGNWAPNPAEKLSRLLGSMKDADGRVLIEGFYDDVVPLSARERQALAAIPPVDDALRHELLLARPDGGGRSLEELINLPSLNIRGLASAWVGAEARTIVPTTATAEIDMRLVVDVEAADQVERLRAHARRQGYHVVTEEPDAGTRRRHANVIRITAGRGVPATRTSMDTPLSRSLIAAVRRGIDGEPVLMPTLGGTVPLQPFGEMLGLPIYGVPMVNHDNNQHAPDENLRLGNLWDGIVLYASVLRLAPAEE